jgi:two-component system OmpR family response regulator
MSPSRTESPQRILLVEDERSLSTAVRRGLEADGYEVEIADDGDEGLRLARGARFIVTLPAAKRS